MSMAQPDTIKSGNERNNIVPAAPKGYSSISLSHRFLQTHRFGEITPHESLEVNKGDIIPMRLMNDTSSYSLKAPIKSDMFQKRTNCFVPLQAIIPNSWELVTAQPNNGDDVPDNADGVVTAEVLNAFFAALISDIKSISYVSEEDLGITIENYLTFLIRNLLTAEMFFSQGSLCKQLYYDFTHCVRSVQNTDYGAKTRSFDAFLEQVFGALAPTATTDTGFWGFRVRWFDENLDTTDRYIVVPDERLTENPIYILPGASTYQQINFRHFLDLARQNMNFEIEYSYHSETLVINQDEDDGVIDYSLSDALIEHLFGDFYGDPFDVGTDEVQLRYEVDLTENINFDRISAYQLVCAHFFSLDYVDYIYSAELYRQLMRYYQKKVANAANNTYTWNGLNIYYDSLSGDVIARMSFELIGGFYSVWNGSDFGFSYYDCYRTALFSFRHSLRYLDYFTGGRTQPLSVGSSTDPRANIEVAVNNNAVNGVEMILAQNAARYLNFASRVGRKISQWLDKLFPGGVPKPDMHDPQWLSTTGDALEPEQTQNTGSAQIEDANSITARFQNNSNRYMFKVQPDRPGYIICVTYYDVPRAYAFATDKENMHCNRYDRFNPFMQYNGSQEVKKQELGIAGDTAFSFQQRYEEYKQKYDVCSGGFVEYLPGFAFIADLQSGLPMQPNLNPSYVRSWNTELDPFYVALTGYGLAAYFHFIVKNVNIIECQRPMEYAPQLM